MARSLVYFVSTLLVGAAVVVAQLPPGLSVDLPTPLRSLQQIRPTVYFDGVDENGVAAIWYGKALGCKVEVEVRLFDSERWHLTEPESVIELLRTSVRAPRFIPCSHFVVEAFCGSLRDSVYEQFTVRLGRTQTLTGSYGSSPIAGFASGPLFHWGGEDRAGTLYALSGVLDEQAYLVKVLCQPEPPPLLEDALRRMLQRGVCYTGPLRNPEWSDAELQARWTRDVPDSIALRRILRTEHYVIMSASSAGSSYVRRLEAAYQRLRALIPFEEHEARRPLPVFVFRDQEDYKEFAAQHGVRNTLGHACGDYFAVPYDGAPNASVHAHEAVHQLMRNRVFLVGGGPWLHEGLADYLATPRYERSFAARYVSRNGSPTNLHGMLSAGRFRALAKPGPLGLRPAYTVSALWWQFFAESRWAQPHFPQILEATALCRPGGQREISAALADVTGVDSEELEKRWLAWCARR